MNDQKADYKVALAEMERVWGAKSGKVLRARAIHYGLTVPEPGKPERIARKIHRAGFTQP